MQTAKLFYFWIVWQPLLFCVHLNNSARLYKNSCRMNDQGATVQVPFILSHLLSFIMTDTGRHDLKNSPFTSIFFKIESDSTGNYTES